MAILSDQGTHCCVADCGQCDFLPFTCDQCKKIFCLDHFQYAKHSCPQAAGLDNRVLVCPLCQKGVKLVGEDPNVAWQRHSQCKCVGGASAKKPRFPVKGCKEQLTSINSFVCTKCNVKVCLKHRFEEDHSCSVGARERAVAARDHVARLAIAGKVQRQVPAVEAFSGSTWQCLQCKLVNNVGSEESSACGTCRLVHRRFHRPLSGLGVVQDARWNAGHRVLYSMWCRSAEHSDRRCSK